MSTVSQTYFARGDGNNAQNASLNVNNTGTFPTTSIYFEKGTLGAGTTGDLILDQDGIGYDADTTVWIGGAEYNFSVELIGTLPVSGKVPDILEGTSITVITVLGYPGGDKRIFFSTDPNATSAVMDQFGNGAITLGTPDLDGPFSPICFTKGTLIACENGNVAVEDLKCGDMVKNSDGMLVEIRWIGHRHITKLSLLLDKSLAPVCFKKDALGKNAPDRDLTVSQQHRMLVNTWMAELLFGEGQVLVAAKHLVNDQSIAMAYPDDGVEYYHILFDTHQIITANGVPSESFHPGNWGMSTLEEAARDEIIKIFPELEMNIESYGASAKPSLKGYEAKALYRMMN